MREGKKEKRNEGKSEEGEFNERKKMMDVGESRYRGRKEKKKKREYT